MASDDRFKPGVIATLAKRAAYRCSNPGCGAITSGPAEDRGKSVNLGIAAHIYGANPGSARYESGMESVDRADITNAIWLCSNCHKLIDDDPLKYPAGLLFEWQREHEKMILRELGKRSAAARDRYEARHLDEFGRLSYLAERIILEKGAHWEYQLTGEVLRFELEPIQRQWRALSRGLYVQGSRLLPKDETIRWISSKFHESQQIAAALERILNEEFATAWGEPGEPGNDTDIIATCRLFIRVCQAAVEWEEQVRFTIIDEIFEEVQSVMYGVVGRIIDEAVKVPEFIRETFSQSEVSGTHRLSLVFGMPEDWDERFGPALKKAARAYKASL